MPRNLSSTRDSPPEASLDLDLYLILSTQPGHLGSRLSARFESCLRRHSGGTRSISFEFGGAGMSLRPMGLLPQCRLASSAWGALQIEIQLCKHRPNDKTHNFNNPWRTVGSVRLKQAAKLPLKRELVHDEVLGLTSLQSFHEVSEVGY